LAMWCKRNRCTM